MAYEEKRKTQCIIRRRPQRACKALAIRCEPRPLASLYACIGSAGDLLRPYNTGMPKSVTSRSPRETIRKANSATQRVRPDGDRVQSPRYTADHAAAGLDHPFPQIETWPNQFPCYEIVVDDPEFTSVCPKTGLPDFGDIEIRYSPDRLCLELKSLKEYLQSFRNLGIFQENVVNQVLEDVVRWAKPVWAEVRGEFRPRGGISTVVIARFPRPKKPARR